MFRYALLAAALLFAMPAHAQTADEVASRIETIFGDAREFERAFVTIQAAVVDEDSETLASYIEFGKPIMVDGEELVLEDQADLDDQYYDLFTDKVVQAVTSQTFETLFVNQDGVMFGSGELWITAVCQDESCSGFDVRIIAINTK